MLFGIIVIAGSLQVGITWGIEGPRAGFFPFYIGLLILVSSLYNMAQTILAPRTDRLFADWGQLRRVFAVVIPATTYVALVPFIGIYISSGLLIGLFIKWLGRYGWGLTLVVGVGLPVLIYIVFERLFLIPLPKGPIEDMLGL